MRKWSVARLRCNPKSYRIYVYTPIGLIVIIMECSEILHYLHCFLFRIPFGILCCRVPHWVLVYSNYKTTSQNSDLVHAVYRSLSTEAWEVEEGSLHAQMGFGIVPLRDETHMHKDSVGIYEERRAW